MGKLVRLKADPKKIRVSVCHTEHDTWWVTVKQLSTGWLASVESVSPIVALKKALRRACNAGFDGIDLDMDWTYPHPQK
jgi:hypothetical protein